MSTYTKKVINSKLEKLLQTLYENEIGHVVAHFSGSCDSGSIHNYDVYDIDGAAMPAGTLKNILLLGYEPEKSTPYDYGTWAMGKWHARNFKTQPLTLFELADDVFYAELEAAHGGWEIDSGSCGRIDLIVHKTKTGQCREVGPDSIVIEIAYQEDEYEDEDE